MWPVIKWGKTEKFHLNIADIKIFNVLFELLPAQKHFSSLISSKLKLFSGVWAGKYYWNYDKIWIFGDKKGIKTFNF